MKFLRKILKGFPAIGVIVCKIGKILVDKHKWRKNKLQIIKKAKELFNEDYSLDVTPREGLFIFHNKHNSLINRGDPYESEVQIGLKILINLDRIRNNNTVFADIGANIGLHTLHVWKNFPSINIIAFDPSPYSYKYLELTIKYNEIKNIRLEKTALSDEKGDLEFYNWGEESSADSLRDTKRVFGVSPKIIKVPTLTLDSIQDLPPISVIKMDTEGAELSILRGAFDTIRKCQPYILLEFHKTNRKAFNVETKQIFDFLEKIDYSILTANFELLSADMFCKYQDMFTENYILIPNHILSLLRNK